MVEGDTGQRSLLRLCIDAELEDFFRQCPLGIGQRISSANGETFVDVVLQMTDELVHWIQCMGPDVEVIYPPELRELIRQSLLQTLHKYRLV